MKEISSLLKELNINVNDASLFEVAFTHPSYNGEANTTHHDYERLEFLGDSVVNFVVATLIYNHYPSKQEGIMSKMRARLVCTESLSSKAKKLNFTPYVLVGSGLKLNENTASQKILENVFEAFMGALYLDQGFAFVCEFLNHIFIDDVINFDEDVITDYKTSLQEEMQTDRRGTVQYRVVESYGPAHAPTFVVEVYFNDICLGRGIGSSKKEAEQKAAKDALTKKAV
jgi:ribonuclease-3